MIRRPALRYYGGKWKLAPWIISYFPLHKNYVEPCGGAASVLIQKPPAKLETYNDLDGYVVNFFQVLRDQPDELIRRIRLTPWSREEYELSKVPKGDNIELARRFFICGWMSISGMPFEKSTGWRSTSYDGQSFVPHLFQKQLCQEELYKIADRLVSVQIENRDARYVIERYGQYQDTLVYFDPPYIQDTRVSKNQYLVETDDDFHRDCAKLLYDCEYVVISGYASSMYTDLYENRGWKRVTRESQTNSGGSRIECLWLSPKLWEVLNKSDVEQGILF